MSTELYEMEIEYKGKGDLYARAIAVAKAYNVKLIEVEQRNGFFNNFIKLTAHGTGDNLNGFLADFTR